MVTSGPVRDSLESITETPDSALHNISGVTTPTEMTTPTDAMTEEEPKQDASIVKKGTTLRPYIPTGRCPDVDDLCRVCRPYPHDQALE
jgi:hypothetical protein